MDVCDADLLSDQSAAGKSAVTFTASGNPLYAYITQFRTIVLESMCPDMRLVVYGFVVAFLMMGFGTLVFMKSQDRFILYI